MEGSYKNRYDVTLLVNGLPASADRVEATQTGDEGGLQLNPALLETQLLECSRAVPLGEALRDLQRDKHKVLRQR
ncbi:MAG: hypothetical protein ACJAT5_000594 [Lentimonas sp.]|jgi:hypothetical protein